MATIKIIQRTKPLANGFYPIFLRITKDRKSKFISLNLSCEKTQWNPLKSEFRKNFTNSVQFNGVLTDIKNRAEAIISASIGRGENITLEEFESLFLNYKSNKRIKLFEYWEDKIENLKKAKNIGNARAYKDAKNSFYNFCKKNDNLYFKDLTPETLNRYEVFLRSNNGTDGGISVKMRTIRALYNDAISNGIISKDKYPFDVYKISKLKKSSNKRALSLSDIEKIRNLEIEQHPELMDSWNYFLFSYFTRGMNFYDMMLLKWSDISAGKIRYVRRKTKGTFVITIAEPVEKILEHYRGKKLPTNYIFPILTSNDLTPLQIEYRKDKTLKKFNKDLKRIAELCKIDTKITSYVSRHSFATNLKQKGVSTDIISEAMGHQTLTVTQAYLKELENDVIDDAINKLI